MKRMLCALLIFGLGLAYAARATAAPQDSGYHLVRKVVLGGPGGWDYFEVDSGHTHRVFVPRVVAINVVEPDGTVVGNIPTTERVARHGFCTRIQARLHGRQRRVAVNFRSQDAGSHR